MGIAFRAIKGGSLPFIILEDHYELTMKKIVFQSATKINVSSRQRAALSLFLLFAFLVVDAQAVTIDWSLIGNAGNAADPADGDGVTPGIQNFGAVPYDYYMGTTDITVNQYVE